MGSREYRKYTIGEVRGMFIWKYGRGPENKWIAYGHLKEKLGLSGKDREWLPQNVYKGRLELILEVLDI
jgi:hypothetical protein